MLYHMKWTKQDREPYVEDWQRRVDDVEDYIENLVDAWHAQECDDVSLYDFLGLEEHEITPWVRDGIVPYRIKYAWEWGDY